jgi:hypothetical protein
MDTITVLIPTLVTQAENLDISSMYVLVSGESILPMSGILLNDVFGGCLPNNVE